MAKKMSNKKKVSAVVAGVLAVTLAIGGAMAWTDYSQTALNTFKNNVDADVLLHDDFDGENKDVYVENTGSSDVYVRVKFTEYLQIGNDSILDAFGTTTGVKADPNDKTTWPVHQFKDAAVNNECDLDDAHKYFMWHMTGAQKEYLAGVTEADGNGYAGLTKAQFDSYNVGDPVTLGDGITTYKRETVEASAIIMLSKWLSLAAGNYSTMSDEDKAIWDAAQAGCWLLDTDGWAYWSAPLAPDTATNLLLDKVTSNGKKPYDNWVYNIDVQLQAATLNEMDRWYLDGRADVADPDNSVATTTQDGYNFIQYIMGTDITYVWEEINTSNVWKEMAVSIVGSKTPTGKIVLGGNDLDPETAADNDMLSGRSKANKGGIAVDVASIDATNMRYNIAGVDTDYYVTAGIDKKLGTYDDVIRSTSGALGKYEITGDSTPDNIGWNYLYGDLDNMLVATEYVLDNTPFYATYDASGYIYSASLVKTKMDDLWDAFGMTATVNDVNQAGSTNELDMDITTHTVPDVWICPASLSHSHGTLGDDCTTLNTYTFAPYYTLTDPQADLDLGSRKFFALSLKEIADAYGTSNTDPNIFKLRATQGAPKWLASSANNYSETGKNYKYNGYTAGDGTQIYTSPYWLRSPGYIGSRAATVDATGQLSANNGVNGVWAGVRPACYLNLSTATTTP